MAIDILQTLADDVTRLLSAGSLIARTDSGLGQRAEALRHLARSVPALAPVSAAVESVRHAEPNDVGRCLFELLLVVQRVRAALATAGVAGKLRPMKAAGPWNTETSSDDLVPVIDALVRRRCGRRILLHRAVKQNATGDLRLVGPLLETLHDRNFKLADFVAERVLPQVGRPVLAELKRDLRFRGRGPEARRLAAVCKISPRLGSRLCRDALRGSSRVIHRKALLGLAATSPRAALELLLPWLHPDTAREVRLTAVDAVKKLGPAGQKAIPTLVGMMDEAYPIGHRAAAALSAIGRAAVPALVKALRSDSPNARNMAVSALGQVRRPGRPAVAALMEAFVSSEANLHRSAIWALQRLGSHAAAALPELRRLLRDRGTEARLRSAAVEVLPYLRGHLREVVPLLQNALEDKDANVAANAARALGALGGRARQAAPDLIDGLRHEQRNVRECCARGLARMGTAAQPALPDLVKALRTGQIYLHTVSYTLEQLGPAAAPAAPGLLELVNDGKAEANSRAAAVRVLPALKLPAGELFPALKAAMRDAKPPVREAAVGSLERLGAAAREMTPEVLTALQDSAAGVRRAATRVLGYIQAPAEEAVPALMQALLDSEIQVVHASAQALSRFGADAEPAIPALKALLQKPGHYGAWTILNTLERLARDCPSAVEVVADTASHGRPELVRTAQAILDRLQRV